MLHQRHALVVGALRVRRRRARRRSRASQGRARARPRSGWRRSALAALVRAAHARDEHPGGAVVEHPAGLLALRGRHAHDRAARARACSCASVASRPPASCSRSITSQSKPAPALISAASAEPRSRNVPSSSSPARMRRRARLMRVSPAPPLGDELVGLELRRGRRAAPRASRPVWRRRRVPEQHDLAGVDLHDLDVVDAARTAQQRRPAAAAAHDQLVRAVGPHARTAAAPRARGRRGRRGRRSRPRGPSRTPAARAARRSPRPARARVRRAARRP